MAAPITAIRKEDKSEEQMKLEKLEELKTLLAEQEAAVSKTMKLLGELNGLGVLDAADSMIGAKEDIAKIVLGQLSKEPAKNLMNTAIAQAALSPKPNRKSWGNW